MIAPRLLIEAPTKEKSSVPVYNFTVEDDHSYFVGQAEGGVWVHNYDSTVPDPDLVFDYNTHPELADSIWQAQKAGFPDTLTRAARQSRNWLDRDGIPNISGFSRDEYPLATTAEGGPGSWVGHVPVRQQSAQGGLINGFYGKYNIRYGDRFNVVVINHP